MERRALRRAADQALLTSLGSAPLTQPGGAPDRDLEYTPAVAGPAATTATTEPDPITEPIPVIAAEQPAPDTIDDYPADTFDDPIAGPFDEPVAEDPIPVPSDEPVAEDPIPVPSDPVDIYDLVPDQSVAEPDRHEAEGAAPTPPPLGTRAPDETAMVHPAVGMALPVWRPRPWYLTKPAAAAAAAAVIAAFVAGGWLMFRSPSTSAEQSTIEAPTSAPPAPTKPAPTAVSASKPAPPPPAPPHPPPPPPPEPTKSVPQRQYSEPRYSPPSPTSKPRVDVTRAPMSVAPVPKPVPGSNSSTPGDAPDKGGRRRGCFGFC
jgi:hypothetical protein